MSDGEEKKWSHKMDFKRILTRDDLVVPVVQEEDKPEVQDNSLRRMLTITNYELAYDHLYKEIDHDEYVDDLKTSLMPGYEKKGYIEKYDKAIQTEGKWSEVYDEQVQKTMKNAFLYDSDDEEFKDIYNSDEDEYHSIISSENTKEYITLKDGKKMLRKTKFVIRSDSFTGGIFLILFNEKGEFKAIPVGKGFVKEVEIEVRPRWGEEAEIMVSDGEHVLHPAPSVTALYYSDIQQKKNLKIIPPHKYLKFNIVDDLELCKCHSDTSLTDLCRKKRKLKLQEEKAKESSSSSSSLDLTKSEIDMDDLPDHSLYSSLGEDISPRGSFEGKDQRKKERKKRKVRGDRVDQMKHGHTLDDIYGVDPSKLNLEKTDEVNDTKKKKEKKNTIVEKQIPQGTDNENDQSSQEGTDLAMEIKTETKVSDAHVKNQVPSTSHVENQVPSTSKINSHLSSTSDIDSQMPSNVDLGQQMIKKLDEKKVDDVKQKSDKESLKQAHLPATLKIDKHLNTGINSDDMSTKKDEKVIVEDLDKVSEKKKPMEKPEHLETLASLKEHTEKRFTKPPSVSSPNTQFSQDYSKYDEKLKEHKVKQLSNNNKDYESSPDSLKGQLVSNLSMENDKTKSDSSDQIISSSQSSLIDRHATKTSVYETLERVDNEMKPLKNKIAEIQRQMWEIDSAYPLSSESLNEGLNSTALPKSSGGYQAKCMGNCFQNKCNSRQDPNSICQCLPGECSPKHPSHDRNMRPNPPLTPLPTATQLADMILAGHSRTRPVSSLNSRNYALWSEPEDVSNNESSRPTTSRNEKKENKKNQDGK